MFDVTLGGHNFRIAKMNARQQFHLSRKLLPVVPTIVPIVMDLARNSASARQKAIADAAEKGITLSPEELNKIGVSLSDIIEMVDLLAPLADAMAGLTEIAADYIMDKTLAQVKVETAPGTWMSLWLEGASRASVIELDDLSKLLPVIIQVIKYNLGNFTFGFLTNHGEPTQKSSGESTLPGKAG